MLKIRFRPPASSPVGRRDLVENERGAGGSVYRREHSGSNVLFILFTSDSHSGFGGRRAGARSEDAGETPAHRASFAKRYRAPAGPGPRRTRSHAKRGRRAIRRRAPAMTAGGRRIVRAIPDPRGRPCARRPRPLDCARALRCRGCVCDRKDAGGHQDRAPQAAQGGGAPPRRLTGCIGFSTRP